MQQASTFGTSVFLGDGPTGSAAGTRRAPVLAAGLLWLAAGLVAGYWMLKVWGHSPVTPVAPVAQAMPGPDVPGVARVLGAVNPSAPAPVVSSAPPVMPVASRFALIGVVAVGPSGGAALIAIDGQAPRPFRVGATLDGAWTLQAVERASVRIAPSAGTAGEAFELKLPQTPAKPA